jgi:hypothetical protein
MRTTYDYSWLLIEGELLYDRRGVLQRRAGRKTVAPIPGGVTVGELFKRLLVLQLQGGLNPWIAPTRHDALQWIVALYRTWTDCDLDEHRSHLGLYRAPQLEGLSPFRQIAIQHFPGVGVGNSAAIEEAFGGSLTAACLAPPARWAQIPITDAKGRSRKLGLSTIQKIKDVLDPRTSP